jgi:WD repeat-containing protein 35
LWRLLAEAAVDVLDLPTAETAYVRCKDYPGIQFVKRLANITNQTIQKAEVAAWFGKYDEAERLYLDVDRRDLAIGLRRRLGDWFKVLQLLKSGGGGTDKDVEEAWNYIGDYYAERHKWEEAVQYYEKSRNEEQLVRCYYILEDYDSLENLVEQLQNGDALLPKIGNMFASVGMGRQAVEAFLKCNHVTSAIDTCVTLNHWHDAVELAKKYNQPTQISSLLAKYAQHLLDEDKTFQAIELYRKANHFLEAAKLLFDVAKAETAKHTSPLRIKKLYVLGALLVEEHQAQMRKHTQGKAGSRSSALIGLMSTVEDGGLDTTGASNIVDGAWRGAEAFHFLMLCQRQLYEGYVDAAMKTALHLREYEDYLVHEDIYCLLALASCANRAFGTCSKAFIRLEALEELSEAGREEYQELAMDIFVKYSPKDARSNRAECTSCETMIPDWCGVCPSCGTRFPACVVTGRPLMDLSAAWSCPTCHHRLST